MARMRVGDDRCQRLIHLVRDGRRQFRKVGSLSRLGELGGGLPQRLLRAPFVLNVERNGVPLHNRSILIA